ncbi:cytochrome P450 [Nocardiopsis sp. EMB25]|uniref:cytochrome P450 family protein n=1 Tax=Nocardiopsis sp. EMB25 TaxID=2835867 RepID=UPI002283301A|nr:cytochrome P450 [Nocardiopsis sp. EMB25]MCY9782686.1 cytochrome P450 [Nocardiopsis sp. EMB25]
MSEAVCPYTLDPQGTDTHGETKQLREQGPIARVELPDGVLAWSVHDYAIAREMMGNQELFSKNPRRNWPDYINGKISNGWPLITWAAMDTMATQDGADHARLRKLLLKAFTQRRVDSMKPYIEATVTELLDKLEANYSGEPIDLKGHFHMELPTRLMCDLFGVPEDRREKVLEGGHKNIDTRISAEVAENNLEQWQIAISELVQYKRENPGDDLTTGMIAAMDEDGSRLSDSEMIGTLHLLLGAGSETLVNALAHASVELMCNRELLAKVKAGEISWEDVFEETLRVESPVAHLPFRFATDDVEIGGVKIAKGDVILIDFAGVGRDPAVHGETADDFDALREEKTHLSFGHGVHFCLGSRLAKSAWMSGIPTLFERFPDIELAIERDELVGQGSFVVNGHATIPVHPYGAPERKA